jgi:hypothetical protein
MTRIAPYYFDNELISANLRRLGGEDASEYVFEVNINDDDLKIRVSNRLADYASDVERWHVFAPKETEAAEAAEGVEVTDRERQGNGPDIDEKTT